MRYSSQLALFLSGFGIFVFGCHDSDGRDDAANAVSDLSDLSAGDQFLMAQALAKLPPKVANAVRDALNAAPGPKSQHSIIQLFGAPKMIALSKVGDENSCPQSGADAVLAIAGWAKGYAASKDDRAAADDQESAYLDAMRTRLSKVDVTNITRALDELSCSERAADQCNARLFTAPGCGDDGNTNGNENCTSYDTSGNCISLNEEPNHFEQDRGQAAENKLASIFRELDAVRPSRAMHGEWNLLRDRYRAGLSQAARETIQSARRGGSATLARDGYAQRRFDEGGRMVDAFVRGNIAFNADAMNLVHAAVAAKDHGRIRSAGHEAFRGRNTNRMYLPGIAVERATADAFAAVRARRDEATPLVAAMFDQRLISIHPYSDANGRTTRLMTDWLLARDGFPPALTTDAAQASVLLWENARIARDAHLEHITEGMRRTVELIEAVS